MGDITRKPLNFTDNLAKAQKIYESLGEDFIKENNGKFIAVNPNTSEYFVGETREEAVKKANQKNKNIVVFTRRIGTIEKVALHSPLGLRCNTYASSF